MPEICSSYKQNFELKFMLNEEIEIKWQFYLCHILSSICIFVFFLSCFVSNVNFLFIIVYII